LIARPRLHYVEIPQHIEEGNEHLADVEAIIKAYDKHRMMTRGLAPKLLVSCRGSKHLKQVLEHSRHFSQLRRTNPGLQVFSILSGQENVKIDEQQVSREDWFNKLRGLRDNQPCVILHYDIISEGIDVPGITGIMPLRNLGLSKYLQTLGRAARLHDVDRQEDLPVDGDWARHFVKPYAWTIIPCYANVGADIQSSVEKYIACLREFGWRPEEDVINTTAGSDNEPEPVADLIDRKRRLPNALKEVLTVVQRIEEQEKTALDIERARSLSLMELLDECV
jgi:hypothetical protein